MSACPCLSGLPGQRDHTGAMRCPCCQAARRMHAKGIRIAAIYGGDPIEKQIKALKSGVEFLVAQDQPRIGHAAHWKPPNCLTSRAQGAVRRRSLQEVPCLSFPSMTATDGSGSTASS